MYYKFVKILTFTYIFAVGLSFIYALFKLTIVDKLILGIGLLFGICVSAFLIKYYKNAVMKIIIKDDSVDFIKANNKTITLKRDDCIRISNNDVRVVLEFNDKNTYYIVKYYYFKVSKFDFSVLNKENFPNAKFENHNFDKIKL